MNDDEIHDAETICGRRASDYVKNTAKAIPWCPLCFAMRLRYLALEKRTLETYTDEPAFSQLLHDMRITGVGRPQRHELHFANKVKGALKDDLTKKLAGGKGWNLISSSMCDGKIVVDWIQPHFTDPWAVPDAEAGLKAVLLYLDRVGWRPAHASRANSRENLRDNSPAPGSRGALGANTEPSRTPAQMRAGEYAAHLNVELARSLSREQAEGPNGPLRAFETPNTMMASQWDDVPSSASTPRQPIQERVFSPNNPFRNRVSLQSRSATPQETAPAVRSTVPPATPHRPSLSSGTASATARQALAARYQQQGQQPNQQSRLQQARQSAPHSSQGNIPALYDTQDLSRDNREFHGSAANDGSRSWSNAPLPTTMATAPSATRSPEHDHRQSQQRTEKQQETALRSHGNQRASAAPVSGQYLSTRTAGAAADVATGGAAKPPAEFVRAPVPPHPVPFALPHPLILNQTGSENTPEVRRLLRRLNGLQKLQEQVLNMWLRLQAEEARQASAVCKALASAKGQKGAAAKQSDWWAEGQDDSGGHEGDSADDGYLAEEDAVKELERQLSKSLRFGDPRV